MDARGRASALSPMRELNPLQFTPFQAHSIRCYDCPECPLISALLPFFVAMSSCQLRQNSAVCLFGVVTRVRFRRCDLSPGENVVNKSSRVLYLFSNIVTTAKQFWHIENCHYFGICSCKHILFYSALCMQLCTEIIAAHKKDLNCCSYCSFCCSLAFEKHKIL